MKKQTQEIPANPIEFMLEEINRKALGKEAEKALSQVLEEAADKARRKREEAKEREKNTWWIVRWNNKTISEVRVFKAVVEKTPNGDLRIVKPKVHWPYTSSKEMRRTRLGALKLAAKECREQIESLEKRIERDKKELPRSKAQLKEIEQEIKLRETGEIT
jgi:hypothetical protein